jgi:hypothetical protein
MDHDDDEIKEEPLELDDALPEEEVADDLEDEPKGDPFEPEEDKWA